MKELTLTAAIENIPAVTDFVESALEEWGCPLRIRMLLDVAVDEIVSNIAYYAYPDGQGTVTVKLEPTEQPRGVTLEFSDGGIPYDPLQREDPDTALSADRREIGGLGIYMVKRTVDSVRYAYQNGRNVLTVYKSF